MVFYFANFFIRDQTHLQVNIRLVSILSKHRNLTLHQIWVVLCVDLRLLVTTLSFPSEQRLRA